METENEMKLVLTKNETSRRTALERTIRQTEGAFVACGNALAEIRDARLYRSTHKTFEEYCQDVWGWTRQRAHQLIGAAGLKTSLPARLSTVVDTERKARSLMKVPSAKLERVVQKAAESGASSIKDIQAIVESVKLDDLQDDTGKPVPEDLRTAWAESKTVGEEIKWHGKALKRVVDKHLREGDRYRQRHNLHPSMAKDIAEVIHALSVTIPYAVCPFCKGEGKKCEKCHSRGWISKIYYNQFVPEKFKKNGIEGNH